MLPHLQGRCTACRQATSQQVHDGHRLEPRVELHPRARQKGIRLEVTEEPASAPSKRAAAVTPAPLAQVQQCVCKNGEQVTAPISVDERIGHFVSAAIGRYTC